ncbi:MAG: hypothetical protein MR543_12355 [Robinsoniella sp.]|nr:hypothetical protein [Robinsoniella sp.]
MEEKNDLLQEMREQNQYLKKQLMCSRILVGIAFVVAVAVGVFVCMTYSRIQTAVESVSHLAETAEQTMTDIQTMSGHVDELVLDAEEVLGDLEPQIEQLEKLDMDAFVESMNGLVKNLENLNKDLEALNLGRLSEAIERFQKAVDGILNLSIL